MSDTTNHVAELAAMLGGHLPSQLKKAEERVAELEAAIRKHEAAIVKSRYVGNADRELWGHIDEE